MINAVTLCILVRWIDETGSWNVTAGARRNEVYLQCVCC